MEYIQSYITKKSYLLRMEMNCGLTMLCTAFMGWSRPTGIGERVQNYLVQTIGKSPCAHLFLIFNDKFLQTAKSKPKEDSKYLFLEYEISTKLVQVGKVQN